MLSWWAVLLLSSRSVTCSTTIAVVLSCCFELFPHTPQPMTVTCWLPCPSVSVQRGGRGCIYLHGLLRDAQAFPAPPSWAALSTFLQDPGLALLSSFYSVCPWDSAPSRLTWEWSTAAFHYPPRKTGMQAAIHHDWETYWGPQAWLTYLLLGQ